MRGFKDFFHETNDIALAKEATVSGSTETEQMQDSDSSKDSAKK